MKLSDKQFVDKEGRRFVYSKELKKSIRGLREEFIVGDEYDINDIEQSIDKIFGDDLIE